MPQLCNTTDKTQQHIITYQFGQRPAAVFSEAPSALWQLFDSSRRPHRTAFHEHTSASHYK